MKTMRLGALVMILLGGCGCPPVEWHEQTDVRCPDCDVVWNVQASETHIARANWCCTCGKELVLTSRPCE